MIVDGKVVMGWIPDEFHVQHYFELLKELHGNQTMFEQIDFNSGREVDSINIVGENAFRWGVIVWLGDHLRFGIFTFEASHNDIELILMLVTKLKQQQEKYSKLYYIMNCAKHFPIIPKNVQQFSGHVINAVDVMESMGVKVSLGCETREQKAGLANYLAESDNFIMATFISNERQRKAWMSEGEINAVNSQMPIKNQFGQFGMRVWLDAINTNKLFAFQVENAQDVGETIRTLLATDVAIMNAINKCEFQMVTCGLVMQRGACSKREFLVQKTKYISTLFDSIPNITMQQKNCISKYMDRSIIKTQQKEAGVQSPSSDAMTEEALRNGLLKEAEMEANRKADAMAAELLAEEEAAKAKVKKKKSKKKPPPQRMSSVPEASSSSNVSDVTKAVQFISLSDATSFNSREEVESSIGGQSTCIVCFTRPKEMLAMPCLHQAVCEECSSRLAQCPYCRTDVASWVKPRLV